MKPTFDHPLDARTRACWLRNGFLSQGDFAFFHNPVWKLWMIRTGLGEEAHLGVHRAGVYTDFT